MSTIANLAKVRGGWIVVTLALLSGCAFSTGGGPLGAAAPSGVSYTVCAGRHASRLPGREQVGQVCRPSSSLGFIL